MSNLREKLKAFAEARDWEQFHSPKNLACALSVEAAELLEHFQWMPEEDSRNLSSDKLALVESELADIFSYLIYIADKLDIDLEKVTLNKIIINEARYPVEKCKGISKKYTDLK